MTTSKPIRWLFHFIAALCFVAVFATGAYAQQTGGGSNPRVATQPRKTKYKGVTTKVAPAQPIFDWFGDHDVTIDYIELRLEEQKLYAFSKGQAVAWSEISTGREGYDTPAGEYKVLQKNAGHKSNLYGYIVETATDKTVVKDANPKTPVPPGCKYEAAAMPFFLRLTNTGIGLHAGYLPGYAASHGCIRLPYDMIEAIYDRVNVGTRVVILPRTTPPPVDAGLTTAAVSTPAPSPTAYTQPASQSYTQQPSTRRRSVTQPAPSETEERIIIERPE